MVTRPGNKGLLKTAKEPFLTANRKISYWLMLILVFVSMVFILSACGNTDDTTATDSEGSENLPSYEQTATTTSEATERVDPAETIPNSSQDNTVSEETSVAATNKSTAATTKTDATTAVSAPAITTTTKSKPAATPTPKPTPSPTPSPEDELSRTIIITIPEGFSLIQIADRLAANGVNTRGKLLDSAFNDDFSSFEVIRTAGMPSGRCWQLEGYLFPDTYEFYRDEDPKAVWSRFIRNFEAKTSALQPQLARFGWTMDNAVTFASLLEKEAGNPNEVTKVSSVMHNRLNSGMRLDLDASILYVEQFIKPNISGDINRFNNYYNTYKTSALPSGPISNPGMRAFNAALNPAATDFLYFATTHSDPPVYYYSKTLAEHDAILREYKIGMYAEN